MTKYILVNRRAGKFTPAEKAASRASVAGVLAMLPQNVPVSDHNPEDPYARRVVVLDLNPAELAAIQNRLPADAILEPVVVRKLHRRRHPIELQAAIPHRPAGAGSNYSVTVTGDGKPLDGISVLFYLQDASGQSKYQTASTDPHGKVSITLPNGASVAFVEPIPYASYWISLTEAPPAGSTIECISIDKAGPADTGWWHDSMGIVGSARSTLGAGIKVGVIDTGCGPHPNLAHVTLAGTFVDGSNLPASDATDVGEHGTHTTGIIGARPTQAGDYSGIAPACDLYHVRVFKSEEDDGGPSQGDIIKAIDRLSRDMDCDLINMSLGGDQPTGSEEDAIRDAAERGTLCLCSAGNSNGAIEYPAAYPECDAVAAMGKIGWAPTGTFSASNRPQTPDKIGKENYFLAAFSCYGSGLACIAPGVGIVSTVPDRGGKQDLYMEMDGTSMASPAACGALAAVLSKSKTYKGMPRDSARTRAARQALIDHCQSIGLKAIYEGRGLPHL